jgi:hypothetical protein
MFKGKILKLLPFGINEIHINSFQLKWKSYGHFEYVLNLDIDKTNSIFKSLSTDMEKYDFWKGATRNKRINDFEKQHILRLIGKNMEVLRTHTK